MSSRLRTLFVAVAGKVGGDPDVARPALGGQVGLLGEERLELGGGQGGVVLEHECGHHLVAHVRVGDGVDSHPVDGREALEDPLDGGGGEVLAVDPHPVRGATGEVDEAVGVLVGEVARPVHAVPHPLVVGGPVVVVALEEAGALGVDQLTHRRVRVDQGAGVVELRDRALRDRLAAVDRDALVALPDRPARRARHAGHDDRRLGRAEAVHHVAVEAAARTPRCPGRSPRCRTRPGACCRRRRAARAWRGRRPAACRRSSCTSRGSDARRRGTGTRRTAAGTMAAPLYAATAHPATTALEWNNGIET